VIVPYLRGFGGTRFCWVDTARNGQQSVLAFNTLALMDTLDIPRGSTAAGPAG
jgi:hypothetical protein